MQRSNIPIYRETSEQVNPVTFTGSGSVTVSLPTKCNYWRLQIHACYITDEGISPFSDADGIFVNNCWYPVTFGNAGDYVTAKMNYVIESLPINQNYFIEENVLLECANVFFDGVASGVLTAVPNNSNINGGLASVIFTRGFLEWP